MHEVFSRIPIILQETVFVSKFVPLFWSKYNRYRYRPVLDLIFVVCFHPRFLDKTICEILKKLFLRHPKKTRIAFITW